MAEIGATLAFELYLIACCLFAPVDKKQFEIELLEGQQEKGIVLYVERTATGFSIYGNKEKKEKVCTITIKEGEQRYALIKERDGKKEEYAIDNSKVKITPLDVDGIYVRTIDACELTFERKQGVRKVYQKDNDKLFLVR